MHRVIVEYEENHTRGTQTRSATEIPYKKTLEVAEAMATAEGEGVQVEWIDLDIGRMLRARDHCWLSRNADQLRERVAVAVG